MRWKRVKAKIIKGDYLEIKTETGHIIKYKIEPEVLVDIDAEENTPYFSTALTTKYKGIESDEKSLSIKEIKGKYEKTNIINPKLEYDHIQLGFIYSNNKDPNNHMWMLNFMDVNNNFVASYNGVTVKLNCPFSTTSWEDGNNWHGRFVIAKKDVKELLEPKQGEFVLNGYGDIGDHKVTSLEKGIQSLSLRYNTFDNTWYCEYIKKGKIVGSTPCKNIICDVPFVGKVDRTHEKPKVTAELKGKDIKGIAIALNALIIKRK